MYLPEKGWQNNNLLPAFKNPSEKPYLITACFAYSEQLGEKRQTLGSADLK